MVERVAMAGLGPVGRVVAAAIDRGLPGYALSAVSARRPERARAFVDELTGSATVATLDRLADHADIVVECAPAALFRDLAEPVIEQGKKLVVLSAGALLESWDLVTLAERTGSRIFVPTGALLGLDAVQAAAQSEINSVRMVTRKPTAGLVGAPFLERQGIALPTDQPKRLFKGTAREAIEGFPANLNVAVALSLAGIGPDRTELEIWADPDLTMNTHQISVESDSANFSFSIENVPSENPKTGRITALSVIALLRKMTSTLSIGT